MLFKSSGKFIDNITDSFDRFGIQTKQVEKGSNKNTQKFEMYDSIHDSSYIAVAVDKSKGTDAKTQWENIIKEDLIPSLNNSNNNDSASALIVPSKDIDVVETLLKEKGLNPTVYQLFTGYVVAGLNKKDTSKILDQYNKNQEIEKNEEDNKPLEDKSSELSKVNNQEDNKKEQQEKNNQKSDNKSEKEKDNNLLKQEKKQDNQPDNIAKQNKFKQDLNTASSNKGIIKDDKLDAKNNKVIDNKPKDNIKQPMSLPKKIATAALLGASLGAGVASAPYIMDQYKDYTTPNNIKAEQQVIKNATEKYFNGLKNGFEPNDELLKAVAENPNLAKTYIDELADTPVKINTAKNPSISNDKLKDNINSKDENLAAAAASNPALSKEDLDKLAKSKSDKILRALASNPSISKDLMNKLSNNKNLHQSLLENPALTPDLLTKISANNPRDCEFNKKYMSNPCVSIQEIIYQKDNPDECVQEGLASNPNTPPEIVAKLAESKNPPVRKAALKNKNIPDKYLNELFPPHWIPDKNNIKQESDRIAALENPKINDNVKNKAVLLDPINYALPIAKNKETNEGLINNLKTIAQGGNGLKGLINSSNNIQNNPKKMQALAKDVKDGKPLDTQIRKMVNKDFVSKVYDPYQLVDSMRSVPSSNNKNNIDQNNKNNNQDAVKNNNNLSPFNKDKSSSILDSNGNPPEYFSKEPIPALKGTEVSHNPEAEKQTLAAADNIVDSIVADVMPNISDAVQSAYNPKGDYNYSQSGINTGENITAPTNDNTKGTFKTPLSKTLGKSNEAPDIFNNACKSVDELHNMF